MFPWLPGSTMVTGFWQRDMTCYHGDKGLWQGVGKLNCGYCGSSVTGLFCLRVSMSDRTPLFTLVETRRDTESPGGEEPQAFWEGGRATKHFWYRSWRRGKREGERGGEGRLVNKRELHLPNIRLCERGRERESGAGCSLGSIVMTDVSCHHESVLVYVCVCVCVWTVAIYLKL